MVEETEYDDVVQCDHSYDRRYKQIKPKPNHVAVRYVQRTIFNSSPRCHQTFVTQYESQQEEECEENFRKSCFIEYEKIAFNETVES